MVAMTSSPFSTRDRRSGPPSSSSGTLRSGIAGALVALLAVSAQPAAGGANRWTPSGKIYGGDVYDLVIDPHAATTLYAATEVGVYRSTDGGDTWAPRGLADRPIHALAVDLRSVAPATLWAGGEGGVFRSTDRGSSWTPRHGGVFDRHSRIVALAILRLL